MSTKKNVKTTVKGLVKERTEQKAQGFSPSWVCFYLPRATGKKTIKRFFKKLYSKNLSWEHAWWAAAEYSRETDANTPILVVTNETENNAYTAMGIICLDSAYNKPQGGRVVCSDFRRLNADGSITTLTDIAPVSDEQAKAYLNKKYNLKN